MPLLAISTAWCWTIAGLILLAGFIGFVITKNAREDRADREREKENPDYDEY